MGPRDLVVVSDVMGLHPDEIDHLHDYYSFTLAQFHVDIRPCQDLSRKPQ